MRAATTPEDRRWEDALVFDVFMTRYPGWTWRDVDDCPRWLLERLAAIWVMRDEAADHKRRVAEMQRKATNPGR